MLNKESITDFADLVNLEEDRRQISSTLINGNLGKLPDNYSGFRWLDRIDPFWEVNYKDMVQTNWDRICVSTSGYRNNDAGAFTLKSGRHPSPLAVSDKRLYNNHSIRNMAALIEFDMLTTEQLKALSDDPGSRSGRIVAESLNNLFMAGLVQKSVVPSSLGGQTEVWVPVINSPEMEQWLVGLEPWQYQLISGGADIGMERRTRSTSGIRHNITTVDMMIKMMELSPAVMGVWGERHTEAAIFDTGRQHPDEIMRNNIGDGAIVTKSGKVIIFESSGTRMSSRGDWKPTTQRVRNMNTLGLKAAAWAAICGRSDIDVHVVFVDINTKSSFRRLRQAVTAGVAGDISNFVVSPATQERGSKKIHVANARSWMPTARSATDELSVLYSVNVGNHIYDGNPELQPIITQEDNTWDLSQNFVTNTLLSLHSPEWATQLVSPQGLSSR